MAENMDSESINEESNDSAEESSEQSEEEKTEQKRKDLLNKVLRGDVSSKKERVAYILNRYTSSRNSDIELAWLYWQEFESDILNGSSVNKSQMSRLTRMSSIIRSRATIQNTYKLFQASDIVKKHRGSLEEEKRLEAVEDTPPDIPTLSVYIDESGKQSEYLIVGGLWIVEGGFSSINFQLDITEWRKSNSIDYEFHFTKLRRDKLEEYKKFFKKFLEKNSTAGFKLIIVKNTGFSDTQEAIKDLTFHLLNKGVIHENDSGRTPLPRLLRVWIDQEEEGYDRIKLENLKERLNGQSIEGLNLGNFESVDSKGNYYVQAVDLFVASVNRKLSNPEGTNYKDVLAEFVLSAVDLDLSSFDPSNTEIDNSIVFNLSDL